MDTSGISVLEELAETVRVSHRLTKSVLMHILHVAYIRSLTPLSTEEKTIMIKQMVGVRLAEGNKRSYIERGTDDIGMIVRFIFPDSDEAGNVSRYAAALRELKHLGVEPSQFGEAIRQNGGLVGLWRANKGRGLPPRTVKQQSLMLSEPITATVGKTFSITLTLGINGIFAVEHRPTST